MFINWQLTHDILGTELVEGMAEAGQDDQGLPMALVLRAFKATGDDLGIETVKPVLDHFLMALLREVQTLKAEGYTGEGSRRRDRSARGERRRSDRPTHTAPPAGSVIPGTYPARQNVGRFDSGPGHSPHRTPGRAQGSAGPGIGPPRGRRPAPHLPLGGEMNVRIADRIKLAVIVVTALIMVYALYVSKDHITHVAFLIGLTGYQAKTLFVLIDIPALIGKALQLKYFAGSTRKVGRNLMVGSGSTSLTCNVLSGWFGGGVGPAGYGAFVVVMFLALENVITRIKPAAAVSRAKNATATKTTEKPTAEPVRIARKCAPGCTCGKHVRAANIAPVSPGVGPVGTYAGRKA